MKRTQPQPTPEFYDLVSVFSQREQLWRSGRRPPEADTTYPRSATADWDPEDDHGDR